MSQHGYSGTPLPRKLGIAAGAVVCLVADPGYARALVSPLPDGAAFDDRPTEADVVIVFAPDRAGIESRIRDLGAAIFPDRALWVAWPKRASGVATDMTEDVIREVALPLGLVDNKVCAIDATWSGLRLVWRRELRDSAQPPEA